MALNLAHRLLAFRFNLLHMPAPNNEKFIEILKSLYTVEEAWLVGLMPFFPSTAKTIARLQRKNPEKVSRILNEMADKGLIVDFVKEHKEKGKPEIKGAVVEGQVLTAAEAEAMKNIPPREVLIAQVVGGISAPLTGLVGGLQGVIRNLVYTLDAVKQKKES